MKSAVAIVCVVPLVVLFYAACSVAPETEAVDNAIVEESPADATEEEPVAVDAQELHWLVYCKNESSAECMVRCAEAGVTCRPSYKHPYKSNAGRGNLTGCIKKPKEVCVYHYPSNGDGCFVMCNTGRAYCVYVGGRR
ncbi:MULTISPECIES: hypothetical protein [Sorangium]|uniref:Secreted protein n=1 Tax=Sorangium cellulosum TaxID=56 RepID=A0A4P2QTR4_SORCE|nr:MULTISPECIES: hypothetical protein [Sorangium]AUX33528.1 uncharacterized protein SOCE836_056880 [Sorangium cellulosum]WCQ92844.1 hypothetical protein NQZ70_05590 [Sorangium sp. Soce836]